METAYFLQIHPTAHFVLSQFFPKNTMSQSPFFDIEYSRSYRLALSRMENIYMVSL